MFTRKAVTVSAAAALALAAFVVPAVNAQDSEPPAGVADTGSISTGSLEGGSLDAGSLDSESLDSGSVESGSAGGSAAEDGEDAGGEGAEGSLGSAGSEDSSLGDLVPTSDEVCELPDLGGSVAKFYPLFGISGVPSGVLDLVTTALGDFPNLLDMVAGEGGGGELLGEAGSVEGPLCSTIFGGEMVMPPVTVIVDGDGNPVTTVTGTIAPSASTTTLTSVSSSTSEGESTGAGDSDSGPGAENGSEREMGAAVLSTSVPSTSVPTSPTPGADG